MGTGRAGASLEDGHSISSQLLVFLNLPDRRGIYIVNDSAIFFIIIEYQRLIEEIFHSISIESLHAQ